MGRSRNGSAASYRHHVATGQAVVTVGGRDIYLGKYGSIESHAKFARVIAEFAVNGSLPRQPEETNGLTVDEVLLAYWIHAQEYYRKDGRPTNELDAMRLVLGDIRSMYGPELVTTVGPVALRAVRTIWIDRGQALTTVNKNLRRAKRVFKWAASHELIPITVYQSVATVEGFRKGRSSLRQPEKIKPVSLQVVERTLQHLPLVTADMVRFQLLTGARPGEVCKLTPGAIDRSGEVWEYRVVGHKTEHHDLERTVYIGPEAQAILLPYLLRESGAVCFSMAESLEQRRQLRSEQRVTPESCGNRRGKRSKTDRRESRPKRAAKVQFDTGSYGQAIKHACNLAFPPDPPLAQQDGESDAARRRRLTDTQRAELIAWQKAHHWSPNRLRHTRATEIRKQFGVEGAQVILGHAAADVTQIYAERDAEKAREIAKSIG